MTTLFEAAHDLARDQLGAYARVYVIDGRYHRNWGNLTELNRAGREVVVGTQMRCGLREIYGARSWNNIAVHHDLARLSAEPCARCFP